MDFLESNGGVVYYRDYPYLDWILVIYREPSIFYGFDLIQLDFSVLLGLSSIGLNLSDLPGLLCILWIQFNWIGC